MDFLSGFLLGLASGVACIGSCGPVLAPYFLSRDARRGGMMAAFGLFLGGRAIGYMVWAIVASVVGQLAFDRLAGRKAIFGFVYVLLATALIIYGLRKNNCGRHGCLSEGEAVSRGKGWCVFPGTVGLLAGLNLCPPIVLAFARAAEFGNLLKGMLFFAAFYVGTSIYLVPFGFVSVFGRSEGVRQVGRLAAAVVGVYYLLTGILMFAGK